MVLLYGRAGRVTATNGVSRPRAGEKAFCTACGLGATHHARGGAWLPCAEAALCRDGAVATQKWLQQKTKQCPSALGGCGALTERDGGCSHISCRMCKFEWCWLCEGKYKGKYTTGTKCPCPQ